MKSELLHLPALDELLQAVPAELSASPARARLLKRVGELGDRAVPTSRLSRALTLGSLPAKLAVGYAVCAVRRVFADAGSRDRMRQEAALQAALEVLSGMGYLRGAVMKVGQGIAAFPNMLPEQCYRLLSTLQFEAPPMHFSLLREQFVRELGAEPEELFAEFEPTAFAAASLGQVHRARLKSGERVAVKIQYPGIARAIASDMANLRAIALPLRLTADWSNMVERLEDMRAMLELEADYEREAANNRRAAALVAGMDEIVVPRVYDEYSSRRILTMDLLEGVHAPDYLARGPSQADKDRFGELLVRVNYRMIYARFVFADPNPGNFVFMDDGRLGLVDFGCCRALDDREWEWILLGARALRYGGELMDQVIRECSLLSDAEMQEAERVQAIRDSIEWVWEPIRSPNQPFDFADPAFMERGMNQVAGLLAKRWTRAAPVFTWVNRMLYGLRGLLHTLEARVPYARVDREETERAGMNVDAAG